MASFLNKAFLLAASLTCFIHLATGYTLVPGITVPPNTPIPPRLEINTFIQNSTRLNIFYLCLSAMQSTSNSQLLSFYRISGIHGTTYAWDNDTGGSFGYNGGYCHHGDVLFPPWHRPYLSLYEKTCLDLATNIVNTFPSGTVKTEHLATLKTWRIPYWDWASNAALPSVVNSIQNVTVTTVKNGAIVNVPMHNPLYSFPLNPNDTNTRPNTAAQTVETVRNPIVKKKVYVSQPTVTNNNMVGGRSGLKTAVYQAFSINKDYRNFSNMADGQNSIEAPHGSVHVTVGGSNGHMEYVSLAAFDPIFFLHHANIDRLVAMWQAINPNSYVSSNSSDFPNENTTLNPFRQTQTQYWTPKMVRDTSVLGYTYPELINCSQQCVTAKFNSLYGPGSSKKKRDTTTDSGEYDEYVVHIKISNCAAYGSFSVHIFLGEPSTNESDYATDPNYVGSFDVFTDRDMPKSHKKRVKGTVPLTAALSELVDAKKLVDMEAETVKDYVTDNLKWTMTGEKIGDYDLDGLDIAVVTSKVKPSKHNYELPKWGKFSRVCKVV